MSITITVHRSLKEVEREKVWNFLNTLPYVPYQQFPEYGLIEGLHCRQFIAWQGETVVGWSQAMEKKRVLAIVEFGPLGDDDTVAKLLLHIAGFYRKKLFSLLRWMPAPYSEAGYQTMLAGLAEKFSLHQGVDLLHWTSKRLSLQPSTEELVKSFSENHRRNIKKAINAGIMCRLLKKEEEVRSFAQGYIAMYRTRGLTVDEAATTLAFGKLYQFLSASGKGFFIGAFKDNILMGGLIILFQGRTAFYYKGYIDHEQRTLPINHLAFYESMVHAKKQDLQWFDLGGYAGNTTDEQLVNINRFKDGFKGEDVVFPKTRLVGLNFLSKAAAALLAKR